MQRGLFPSFASQLIRKTDRVKDAVRDASLKAILSGN